MRAELGGRGGQPPGVFGMGAGSPGAPRSRLQLRVRRLPRACMTALHGARSQCLPPHSVGGGVSGSFRGWLRGRIKRKGKRWLGEPCLHGFGAKERWLSDSSSCTWGVLGVLLIPRGGGGSGGFTCAGSHPHGCRGGDVRRGSRLPCGPCCVSGRGVDTMVGEVWDKSRKSL